MLQEKRFDTGEVVLNYAQGPQTGPPLVLMHGLPGRWQEFLPIIDVLAESWQVFALDMRGQGFSGHLPGSYLPEDYTGDLIAFLQKGIGKPAVLFGMSAGGLTALHVASIIPDMVLGLVIGDSPINLEALAAWMNSASFAAHFTAVKELISQRMPVNDLMNALGEMPVRLSGMAEPPRYRELHDQAYLLEWAETIHTMDPDVLRNHAAGRGDDFLHGLDMDAVLRQITCPTLLIRADPKLGALLSAEASEHGASLLGQGADRMIEGEGHSLGLDGDADSLLIVLEEFLAGIRGK